jgi:hypothetical protein
MKQSTIEHYVRQADREHYGYQTYGGDASIAALRCFRGYHPQARLTWVNTDGSRRWMTPTMLRIHSVLARESMRPNGDLVKLRDMAKEARTSPGYFSKMLLRFEAWGMFASESIRGRKGGLYVWARKAGDTFERYAIDARIHLRVLKVGQAARNLRKYGEMFPPRHTRVLRETQETFSEAVQGVIREGSAIAASMARHPGPGGREGRGIALI